MLNVINWKDIACGVEAANGFVKGLSSISETGLVDTYLNTITVSNEKEYKHYKDTGLGQEVYFINGQYFKVGLPIQTGLTQKNFTSRNDVKYEDPMWQIAFIIGVYRQIKDSPSLTVSKVFVTTGLPANDDKKGSVKRKIREAFVKIHEVNGQKFSIDELYFLGQGTSSLYNDMFNLTDEGKLEVNKKFIASTAPEKKNDTSRVMYVDAGYGTLLYALANDYAPQPDKTLEENGMESIWRSIKDELTIIKDDDDEETIKKKEENEWLINIHISEVEDQIREGHTITVNHRTIDISDVFDQKMMEFARDTIKRLYIGDKFDNMVYNQVKFVGGGSTPLRPFLEQAIEEYHKGNEGQMAIYKFADKPQWTNCRGYLKFALANIKKYREQKEAVKK